MQVFREVSVLGLVAKSRCKEVYNTEDVASEEKGETREEGEEEDTTPTPTTVPLRTLADSITAHTLLFQQREPHEQQQIASTMKPAFVNIRCVNIFTKHKQIQTIQIFQAKSKLGLCNCGRSETSKDIKTTMLNFENMVRALQRLQCFPSINK